MIKIYSASQCLYCTTLKAYFESKRVQFQEIDVSKSEQELEKMVKTSGQRAVPVVDIENNIVIGFDRQRIEEILHLKT